jgi:hypothetical protein
LPFEHDNEALVRLEGDGDERAPGAAITVALCGHWEHQSMCRWPHLNVTERTGEGLLVRTSFDAPASEVAEVRRRINDALASGQLMGPDGRVTCWSLLARPPMA